MFVGMSGRNRATRQASRCARQKAGSIIICVERCDDDIGHGGVAFGMTGFTRKLDPDLPKLRRKGSIQDRFGMSVLHNCRSFSADFGERPSMMIICVRPHRAPLAASFGQNLTGSEVIAIDLRQRRKLLRGFGLRQVNLSADAGP